MACITVLRNDIAYHRHYHKMHESNNIKSGVTELQLTNNLAILRNKYIQLPRKTLLFTLQTQFG